jgi:hypothetical protein
MPVLGVDHRWKSITNPDAQKSDVAPITVRLPIFVRIRANNTIITILEVLCRALDDSSFSRNPVYLM